MKHDRLYAEVLQHCHFCKNLVKQYKGREAFLEKATTYILDQKGNHPCIIYGPGGSGKSSIIAKIAVMVKPHCKV